MAKKKNVNYLDLVPKHSENHKWDTNEQNIVTIYVENKGLFNRIAQRFFHKPEVSQIHLDELGSFIWQQIDGKRTVYDISQSVKAEFGDKCEPLYNRLVQYTKTLEDYGFIEIKK